MSHRLGAPLSRVLLMAAAAAVALASPAAAATLTKIIPYADPLGGWTNVHGINDLGQMTGTIAHVGGADQGFVRDAAGHYTTFSQDVFTEGRAIDDAGNISLITMNADFDESEFIRHSDGSIEALTNPIIGGPLYGIIGQFDSSGEVVGDFLENGSYAPPRVGYEKGPGGYTLIEVPGATGTAARGINDHGVVVGWYNQPSHINPGFIYSGGVFQTVMHAGARATNFEAVNNAGIAVGGWNDATGADHPFLYNIGTGVFTDLNVPGGGTAWSINDAGQVISSASDLEAPSDSWLYDPSGTPEPALWISLIAGFGLAGARLRRRRLQTAA